MKRTLLVLLVPVLAVLGLFARPACAQDNAACMRCHQDRELTVERGDEELPGWIDEAVFSKSVHGSLDCVACHQDLEDAKLPHADELEPVDCGTCHAGQAKKHAASIHGQALASGDPMAPSCADCHGKHDVRRRNDPESRTYVLNIPRMCGSCHHEGSPVSRTHDIPQERIFENYSQSIHGQGLYEKGLTVTAVCTSCHTSHDILPHTDPRASVSPQRIVSTCTTCHSGIERVHRKVIEGRLWESEPHKIPNCVDCHSPHKVRRPFYPEGMANKDCATCHGRPSLTMERDGQTVSLYVDEAEYAASVHKDVGCAQCHAEATKSLERACATIKNKVDCSSCHADQVEQYQASVHAKKRADGLDGAPECVTCHTKHAIRSRKDRASPTFPRHVPDLCGSCHKIAGGDGQVSPDSPTVSYAESAHGKGLNKSGLLVTATCVDCHGGHAVLPQWDPKSSVNGDHIAATCGKCHDGIQETYEHSIHWRGRQNVSRLLPSCKDCHASHNIARIDEGGFRNAVRTQCGACHQEQFESYFETFHGKVSRLGFDRAATCSDCHGNHDVQHVTNPESHVSAENRVATCRKCHPAASVGFTQYLAHGTHTDRKRYPELFWVFWGMTGLLVGTMAFFGVHSIAWMVRLWTVRREWAPLKAAGHGGKLYRRFTPLQRGMHFTMVLSFFTLAFTGMSLKFSYTGWGQAIAGFLGGFDVTGVLHRIAALVLIGVFVTHLASVNSRRRAEGLSWKQLVLGPNSIVPLPRDLFQFLGTLKWFVGRGPRPRYGRWAYWEKFDYFAVFWGVAIIGSTGLLLWFPELLTRVVPGWLINVATIIHGDEALLAVAFIFTIHFFNTQFRPDKFPLDPVVFTGRMGLEELKYDKPEEYAELVRSGRLEEHLVDPLPKPFERVIRVFAVSALTFGICLVLLILAALFFIKPV